MKSSEALAYHDVHIGSCEHIGARKPCTHEVTIECASCRRPFRRRIPAINMGYGTTCDVCIIKLEPEASA